MKILIIGGTSFVGRAISWSAWHHGHDVAVLNRGVTPNDLPESIERLVGDRQSDLSVLKDRSFDVTIDVTAYRPSDVERLARALGSRGGHYVQISSASVYRDPGVPGAGEAALSLVDDKGVDAETYGPLKAASERAGTQYFGEGATFVRPTFVIGAYDTTLRFPYWVERLRRGGDVAVAGPGTNAMQYVDARDLANFVVRIAEEQLTDAFHVAGPELGDQFMTMIAAIASHVAPEGTTLHEVSPEHVIEEKLAGKFPFWTGKRSSNTLALSSARAIAKGLELRPLEESIDDVTSWWGDREWPTNWLSDVDEARLLAR